MAFQRLQSEYEATMRKLDMDLQQLETEQTQKHEIEMKKLEIEEKKADAEVAHKMAEADRIKAANERYRMQTDEMKRYIDTILDGIQLQMEECRKVQQLEFSKENNELLTMNVQKLISMQSSLLTLEQ